jgi:hypothetical protein
MHKNATKCNKTQSKWCINKHGASKIIDTFETYHALMKKSDKKFEWTEEADAAFSRLKIVLFTRPVLVAPKERDHYYYTSRPTSSGKHGASG